MFAARTDSQLVRLDGRQVCTDRLKGLRLSRQDSVVHIAPDVISNKIMNAIVHVA
jgi:hypothetical protein